MTDKEETKAVTPAEGEKDNKRGGQSKKEEVPIEELYDLSKPIPHVRSWVHRYAYAVVVLYSEGHYFVSACVHV